MALINCLECEAQISSKAKQCPKCGYPVGNIDEVKPMSIEQLKPNIEKSTGFNIKMNDGYKMLIGLVLLIFIVVIYKTESRFDIELKEYHKEFGKEDRKTVKTTFTDNEAAYAAQLFVEKQLKLPSTADFEALFKSEITRNGKEYTVISHVISDNSFGGKVRNKYIAVIKRNTSGGVSLIDLVIE